MHLLLVDTPDFVSSVNLLRIHSVPIIQVINRDVKLLTPVAELL